MKLCIPSGGMNIDANVEMAFSQTAYFLIVDTEDQSAEVVEYTSDTSEPDRGIKAAQLILDKKIEGVLAGYMGLKAFITLRNAGVMVYEGMSQENTVKDAISNFKNNLYIEASDPLINYPTISGQGIEFVFENDCATNVCCVN